MLMGKRARDELEVGMTVEIYRWEEVVYDACVLRRRVCASDEDEDRDERRCFHVVYCVDGRCEKVDFSQETWRLKKHG